MQTNQTQLLISSSLNGAYHQGNFVWGGAMNICWQTLESEVIGGPLVLKVDGELAQMMVKNFKDPEFTKKDLTEDSYYTKAGFGQQTLDKINKECREKFPKKSFKDIEMKLFPTDIISYAYFVKQVQYLNPFSIKPKLWFNNTTNVKGFKAKEPAHFDNIRVSNFKNNDEFVIKLLLKQQNQELFVVKGHQKSLPQQIVSLVQQHANVDEKMQKGEVFEMPVVELDVKREYKELIGAPCLSKGFTEYRLAAMFEGIKFKIDEVGAKVENEAVMMMTLSAMIKPPNYRKFIVDSPFWVVMKQKKCHPYFLAHINNTEFMTKA